MNLNRRGFLATILASLVGGTTVSVSTEALADPVLGRYAMAIKLQQDLYAKNLRCRELVQASAQKYLERTGKIAPTPRAVSWGVDGRRIYPARVTTMHAQLTTDADVLLAYVMENFVGEETREAHYQVSDLFDGRLKADTLTIEGLQSLLDIVIPIAIAKRMLSVEKIPLNTMKMPSFDIFANRFKDIILGCERRPYDEACLLYPEWAAKMGETEASLAKFRKAIQARA